MTAPERRTTTVRLGEASLNRLQNAARILNRTQSQVMEQALEEYCEKHRLNAGYVAQVSRDGMYLVLMRVERGETEVLEVRQMNGVPLQQMVDTYALQLKAPVFLSGFKE